MDSTSKTRSRGHVPGNSEVWWWWRLVNVFLHTSLLHNQIAQETVRQQRSQSSDQAQYDEGHDDDDDGDDGSEGQTDSNKPPSAPAPAPAPKQHLLAKQPT